MGVYAREREKIKECNKTLGSWKKHKGRVFGFRKGWKSGSGGRAIATGSGIWGPIFNTPGGQMLRIPRGGIWERVAKMGSDF